MKVAHEVKGLQQLDVTTTNKAAISKSVLQTLCEVD